MFAVPLNVVVLLQSIVLSQLKVTPGICKLRLETNNKQNTRVSLFPLLVLQSCEDTLYSGLSFFGKMSLFRCGFTVQKKLISVS